MGIRAKRKKEGSLTKTTILALDKTMYSTVIGPMDIFSLTGVLWNQICGLSLKPCFEVDIVSIDGKKVNCLNGVEIKPHRAIKDIQKTDLIIISAADLNSLERDKKRLIPWLIKQYEQGATLVSVCTGAFALAETGLLNGKKATTHWGFAELFRQKYPEVILKTDLLITDEGRLMCGGGAHSYFDLCLYLVEKYCGFEIAMQSSKSLLLDMGRRSQTAYALFEFQKRHGDLAILKAQKWIEQNFSQQIHIEQIASFIGMSLRNFKRRFKQSTGDAPLAYLQRFRIESAKRALERGKKSIDEISHEVGYNDTAFFRQIFKKYVGEPPTLYRKKFVHHL